MIGHWHILVDYFFLEAVKRGRRREIRQRGLKGSFCGSFFFVDFFKYMCNTDAMLARTGFAAYDEEELMMCARNHRVMAKKQRHDPLDEAWRQTDGHGLKNMCACASLKTTTAGAQRRAEKTGYRLDPECKENRKNGGQ